MLWTTRETNPQGRKDLMGRRPTRARKPQGLSGHKGPRPARHQQTRARQGRKGTKTTTPRSPHGNPPRRDLVNQTSTTPESPQGISIHKGRSSKSTSKPTERSRTRNLSRPLYDKEEGYQVTGSRLPEKAAPRSRTRPTSDHSDPTSLIQNARTPGSQ